MDRLYDLTIDLSSNDGAIPRCDMADWMRVRLHGHSVPRKVQVPVVIGSIFFKNDGGDDVSIRHGAALPIVIGRGEVVHVMFDGTPNGMDRVGG